MNASDRMRLNRLEAVVARLDRQAPTGRGSFGTSTNAGGALNVRTVQLGFAAELTSSWDDATGYDWKRLFLDTANSPISLTDPGVQPTGDQAFSTDQGLASGAQGWMEPSPDGVGYLFTAFAGESGGGTDCDDAAGWPDTACLLATLTETDGSCTDADADPALVGQTVHLANDGTASTETFTINGKDWALAYSWTPGACCPTATLTSGADTVHLTSQGCRAGKVRFTTADPLLCAGATTECAVNKIAFEIECVPARYWCVDSGSSGAAIEIVSACVEPADSVGGPYDTAEEALAACGEQWWCTGTSLPGTCTQSATEPADAVAGPFTTEADCTADCSTIIGWGGEGWYCIWNGSACVAAELLTADSTDPTVRICSGPYASEAAATAACPGDCCPLSASYTVSVSGVGNGVNDITGNPTIMTGFNRLWTMNGSLPSPTAPSWTSGLLSGGFDDGGASPQTEGEATLTCSGGAWGLTFYIGADPLATYTASPATCTGDITFTLQARTDGQIDAAPGFPATLTVTGTIP